MQVEVGVIVEGKITGLTKFGAFVELPSGGTGMVHISEVASTYVKEITDFLSEGQVVKVKVIGVNEEGKISLSIKQAQEPAERPQRAKPPYSQNSGGGRRQSSNPNVWQGQKTQNNKNMSFEDMMQKFKQVSDEKMTDLKHFNESKHGGGFSRRGGNNRHK